VTGGVEIASARRSPLDLVRAAAAPHLAQPAPPRPAPTSPAAADPTDHPPRSGQASTTQPPQQRRDDAAKLVHSNVDDLSDQFGIDIEVLMGDEVPETNDVPPRDLGALAMTVPERAFTASPITTRL
jgi:hypothetical protein